MNKILDVKEVTILYGKAIACQGVSLYVQEGEVVSIIGANGAGKTTILKTISGFKKPVCGEIWFQNKRIDGIPPHQIAKMGIVQIPAGRMIVAPMTVLDNLKLGAFRNRDRGKLNQNLEKIYAHFPILKERRSQLAGRLSGGQQQILAVGRALMSEPKLLLMDEPSMGLSPVFRNEVSNIIREIKESGISILLVEQNCRMALKLAQRAYILELGSIALQGDACDLSNDERVQKCYLGGI